MYYFYLVRSVEAYDVNIYRMHAAFMKDALFALNSYSLNANGVLLSP